MNSTQLPDDPADRRRVLREITPSDVQCAVPGCTDGRVTDDCCYAHSLRGRGECGKMTLPNDGIIDWTAIDVAARGLRRVRLTWVEKDIAVGIIFARSGSNAQARALTDVRVGASRARRVQAAWRIAEALKRTSNEDEA